LTLEVPDAPEARIDLALPEASIGGRVVDDRTGDPVKGATATLRSLSAEGGGGGMFGSFLSREGRTRRDGVDDQGVFDFDRLEGGNYELQVSAGGGDYAPSEPLRVVVVANRVEDGLVVRLLPALSIQGVVVDEQGAPIPDARVVAQPAGAVGDPRGASDRCDAQGAFEVRGLAAGEYDLVATAPGRASARVAGVKVARDLPPKPTTILLPRGTNIVAIVRQNGAPVAGARGRVVAKDAREGELDPEATGAMLQQFFQGAGGSGEDGRLDLGRHAAGEWRVEVQRASSARGVKLVKIDGLDGVVEVVVDLP
jgi:protocatechuate 3,4-dioxygenase beta subunit